ncbi:type III secretion low calcium response chaperone LcrH/SycD [Salmonella enterica subsp. enterica]|uniref:Type III secretion low calcium response chaperone LcrH/SycD n=1 Tax=Salmonella enterica I TaxID=59201 RepID=A0A379VTB1_SALET|nr:type III secretion low calcium response chaperone LcrH/SycD [Salmonella enterica subsp. enterica]
MKKDPTLQQAHDTMRFFRRGGSLRMLLDDDVTQPLNTLYRYAMQLYGGKRVRRRSATFSIVDDI